MFAHKVMPEIRCVRSKLSSGSFAWSVFVNNFSEFLLLDLIERFAALIQGFEGFDDGFGHALVGLTGAAYDRKTICLGNPLVAVSVV